MFSFIILRGVRIMVYELKLTGLNIMTVDFKHYSLTSLIEQLLVDFPVRTLSCRAVSALSYFDLCFA